MPESHLQTLYESRNPDLRAGDHDRDAVADILREQHVAGRLHADELQERIDRCFGADDSVGDSRVAALAAVRAPATTSELRRRLRLLRRRRRGLLRRPVARCSELQLPPADVVPGAELPADPAVDPDGLEAK